MQRELDALGFDTGNAASPVIPIAIGDDMDTYAADMELQDEGIFVNPVVPPAVPPGRALIRTSYMATHTRDHLDLALEALAKIGRRRGLIP